MWTWDDHAALRNTLGQADATPRTRDRAVGPPAEACKGFGRSGAPVGEAADEAEAGA